MKSLRTVVGILGAAFLLAPGGVSAEILGSSQVSTGAQSAAAIQDQIDALLVQVQELQALLAQLQASTPAAAFPKSACDYAGILGCSAPWLPRNLSQGDSGEDVEQLQRFLTQTGDFTYPDITGYFGPITEAAVKRYQTRHNIVSSGDRDTTGWGVVGPVTRSVISAFSEPSIGQADRGSESDQTNSAEDDSSGIGANATQLAAFSSCLTPWGGRTVAHDQTVSSQPYFTNGSFTYSAVVPLMRCNNGSWLRCDYQGNNCQAYAPSSTKLSSCAVNGEVIPHGSSAKLYSAEIVQSLEQCAANSQVRTCQNGTLTGSGQYRYLGCTVTSSADSTGGQTQAGVQPLVRSNNESGPDSSEEQSTTTERTAGAPGAPPHDQGACWSNYEEKWIPEGERRPNPGAPKGFLQMTGTGFITAYVCRNGEWEWDGAWIP